MKSILGVKQLNSYDKFFIFWVVICSGTLASQRLPVLYGLVFAWLLLFSKRQVQTTRKILPYFSCFVLLWVVQLIFNGNMSDFGYLVKNALVIFATITYFSSDIERMQDKCVYFVELTIAFSIVSNVIFMLALAGVGLPTIPTNELGGGLSVYYLSSFSENPFYGFNGLRNYGIYWEPGMYQVYLCFVLLFTLYTHNLFNKRRKLLMIGYLLISIITTGSVTGYALSAFIIALYLLRNNSGVFVRILFAVAFIVGVIYMMPRFEEMLDTKQNVGNSYAYRTLDFFEAVRIFWEKPIFGYGIVNHAYEQGTLSLFDEMRGSSNGIGNLLLNYGIIGCSIIMMLLIRCSKYLKQVFEINPLSFLVFFVISIMSEPYHQHPFFYMFLGLGLCIIFNKQNNEKHSSC